MKVSLSEQTQNLSGEKTPWCPDCGKRASYSSPKYTVEEPAVLAEAAPELLAALQKCLTVLNLAFDLSDDPFDEHHNQAVDAMIAAEAAIAKATISIQKG